MITESLEATDDQETQAEYLVSLLMKKSEDEIMSWHYHCAQLSLKAYSGDLWCAAFLLNEGCSDDEFTDFRAWLISRGKIVFEKALENPDLLSEEFEEDAYYEFEEFEYLAMIAYEEAYQKDLVEEMLKSEKYPALDWPELKFNWKEDDPKSLSSICPKIAGLAGI